MLSGDGLSTPSRDDGSTEQQSLTDCQSNHSPMSVLVASGVDGTTLPPIEQGGHRAVHSCAVFNRGVPCGTRDTLRRTGTGDIVDEQAIFAKRLSR